MVEYFDNELRCMVRLSSGGALEKATMTPGPAGMALADFGDGKVIETECPNLLLKTPVMKKPSAPMAQRAKEERKKAPAALPVAEMANDDDDKIAPKVSRKNLYSKVYHEARMSQEEAGASKEEAKELAREAAQQAVSQARHEGRLS